MTLRSDAEIEAVTVGERKPHDGSVVLSEYDSSWPEKFRLEDERIRKTLGDRVERLEHVGSTSVPGLAAKPVLDLLLVVRDSAHEASYVPELESLG